MIKERYKNGHKKVSLSVMKINSSHEKKRNNDHSACSNYCVFNTGKWKVLANCKMLEINVLSNADLRSEVDFRISSEKFSNISFTHLGFKRREKYI